MKQFQERLKSREFCSISLLDPAQEFYSSLLLSDKPFQRSRQLGTVQRSAGAGQTYRRQKPSPTVNLNDLLKLLILNYYFRKHINVKSVLSKFHHRLGYIQFINSVFHGSQKISRSDDHIFKLLDFHLSLFNSVYQKSYKQLCYTRCTQLKFRKSVMKET